MRLRYLALLTAISFGASHLQPAHAVGCLSGGAAGAVAGHLAHHHAVIGAVGGCIAGHEIHKHNKKLQEQAARQQGMQNPSSP